MVGSVIKGTKGENIAFKWKLETSQEFSSDIIQGPAVKEKEATHAWTRVEGGRGYLRVGCKSNGLEFYQTV